ncbi:MAG: radical SAM protein, partial [Candidatus Heimdallarchaeota archaeon]|nr:radical SAM protein [Candidatus Heimdallarchaeota archaeon]MCK5049107.1 radical SAM protein [Candidatus Heimdallarchaeota archaeon]
MTKTFPSFILIIDALGAGTGRRMFTRDVIGAGTRTLAGIFEVHSPSSQLAILNAEVILESSEIEAIKKLGKGLPDLILMTGMTMDLEAILLVNKRLKSIFPKPIILIGGPILTDPQPHNSSFLNNFTAGIIGEGEPALIRLIHLWDNLQLDSPDILSSLHSLPGAVWMTNGSLQFGATKVSVSSSLFLSQTPSFERIIDYPNYRSARVFVEIGRGCSNFNRSPLVRNAFQCQDCGNCESSDRELRAFCPDNIPPGCGYCSVPSLFGYSRSRSSSSILSEVQGLVNMGVSRIVLSAPCVLDYGRDWLSSSPLTLSNSPPANIHALTELFAGISAIKESSSHPVGVLLENIKPSLCTEEVANLIGKHFPGTTISIGCETGSMSHSYAIGRPSDPTDSLRAAAYLSKAGVYPQLYFIHSMPGETVASLKETMKLITKTRQSARKMTVYRYRELPGSSFTWLKGQGLEPSPLSPYKALRRAQKQLKDLILEFNSEGNKQVIGKTITVIVGEADRKLENYYICYPLLAGPAVSVFLDPLPSSPFI